MPYAPRPLRICFYAPFKPLGHAHPSGDLVTATGIFNFLVKKGHQVVEASSLRCRWVYWKPWRWPRLLWERKRVVRRLSANRADLWFTYHSYYKAPDLLGPFVSKQMGMPYIIFQGIYATKRRRELKTMPGFYLNKSSLCAASHVFANKKVDLSTSNDCCQTVTSPMWLPEYLCLIFLLTRPHGRPSAGSGRWTTRL